MKRKVQITGVVPPCFVRLIRGHTVIDEVWLDSSCSDERIELSAEEGPALLVYGGAGQATLRGKVCIGTQEVVFAVATLAFGDRVSVDGRTHLAQSCSDSFTVVDRVGEEPQRLDTLDEASEDPAVVVKRLWTKAVGTPRYRIEQWQRLLSLVDAPAASTPVALPGLSWLSHGPTCKRVLGDLEERAHDIRPWAKRHRMNLGDWTNLHSFVAVVLPMAISGGLPPARSDLDAACTMLDRAGYRFVHYRDRQVGWKDGPSGPRRFTTVAHELEVAGHFYDSLGMTFDEDGALVDLQSHVVIGLPYGRLRELYEAQQGFEEDGHADGEG